MEIVSKVCRECKIERPISDFGKRSRETDGFYNHCKFCLRNAIERRRVEFSSQNVSKGCKTCGEIKALSEFGKRHDNPDGYEPHCRECTNRKKRATYRKNAANGNARTYHFRRKYGITPADYDTLLQKQNGLCAICGKTNSKAKWHPLAVDHCHETGKIRGLLCHNCNHGLGCFQDNAVLLTKALDYLKE